MLRALLILALLLPLPALAAKVGYAAPKLEAQTLDGKSLNLNKLKGSVVYVDFWASWCGPCQLELPALMNLQSQLGKKGFKVITVNVDEERQPALDMIRKLKLSLPVIPDPKGTWAEKWVLDGMPMGYLIGRDGMVKHIFTGFEVKNQAAMEKIITDTVGAKS